MINKVGRFCLAKGVKFVWLFHLFVFRFYFFFGFVGTILAMQEREAVLPLKTWVLEALLRLGSISTVNPSGMEAENLVNSTSASSLSRKR